VNTFEELLADWEFGDEWRPLVERLAERVADWPSTAPDPDDFYVSHAIGSSGSDGLLVWADLLHPARNVIGACLGAQVDRTELRCGALNPHNPGDHLEVWLITPRDRRSFVELADGLLDWFACEAQRWQEQAIMAELRP